MSGTKSYKMLNIPQAKKLVQFEMYLEERRIRGDGVDWLSLDLKLRKVLEP